MMFRRFVLMFVVLVMVAFAALPASAAPQVPTTGERILVSAGDQDFPAGDPFHIRHGWGCEVGVPVCELPAGNQFTFRLFVDGTQVHGRRLMLIEDTHWVLRVVVFNFRHGMTGTHTFRGEWRSPEELFVREATVTFVP